MALTISRIIPDEKIYSGYKSFQKGVLSGGDTGGSTTEKWDRVTMIDVVPQNADSYTAFWNPTTKVITFAALTANSTFTFSVEGLPQLIG